MYLFAPAITFEVALVTTLASEASQMSQHDSWLEKRNRTIVDLDAEKQALADDIGELWVLKSERIHEVL